MSRKTSGTIPFGESEAGAFRLPIAIATETTAILGRRGSGKSNTLTVCIEGLLTRDQQVVLIDPKGEGWGLRSSADGRASGYPIIIFGEPKGDLPLDQRNGAMLADFVVDSGRSCVFSMAAFRSDAAERRFVRDFAERLYRRKLEPKHHTPLLVAIEEAHLFVPQRVGGDEAQMVRALQRLVRQGRSFGIGVMLADQRPASVNKDVLTQLELLICHQLTSPQDRKAVREWVEAHDTEDQAAAFMDSLAGLRPGVGWVWSPSRLNIFARVSVKRRSTFDSGATPDGSPGTASAPRTMASVDLEQLREQLATSVQEAEANDPAARLHARIRELERQVSAKQPTPVAEVKVERVEVPILREQDLKRIDAAAELVRSTLENVRGALESGKIDTAIHKVTHVAERVREIHNAAADARSPHLRRPVPPGYPREHEGGLRRPELGLSRRSQDVRAAAQSAPGAGGPPRPSDDRDPPGITTGDLSLGKAQQSILNALAFWESIGVNDPGRNRIALVAGYHPRTKGFMNALGALRSGGLVDGEVLTPAGRELAAAPEVPRTLADVHAALKTILRPGEAHLFNLIAAMGAPTRDDLAAKVGLHPRTKGFLNNLGRLRSLGIIEYQPGGVLAGTELMWPEGLA